MSASDFFTKAYCRIFHCIMHFGSKCLYWRRPIVYDGENSIEKIPEILKKCNSKKPLLVTGPHLVLSIGPRMEKIFNDADFSYAIFSDVEPNPSVTTVNAIYDAYTSNKCDAIVAIGGGSPIDAAKGAGARIANNGKSIKKMGGLLRVLRKLPPFIAVPTTSGTGSETTIAAVITDKETKHKYAVMDVRLIPLYAVLDPVLAAGMSPKTTATTGMDALTHAVEAYICWAYNTKNSIKDAEEATCLIFKYLEQAYKDGNDLNARQQMMIAAYKAGFAFSRAGVGNVHAIAHTLGGFYGTPHGLANAVLLPIVLEDYGEVIYPKLARLCELTGLKTDGTVEEKAKAFISEIKAMNERMNVPKGLDVVQEEDIPLMIKYALKEANPVYPVPVIYNYDRCKKIIDTLTANAKL